jgi:small-conductance mechanosensitive channel
MTTLYRIIFAIVFLFTAFLSYSQKGTTLNKDSANTVLLNQYIEKLDKIEKQRLNDSIKKEELQNQLDNLKTIDDLKKVELENQIKELREKNTKVLKERIARIDSLRNTAKKFPVFGFFEDTLFDIYTKSGSISAEMRSNLITDRIQQIGKNYISNNDSITLVQLETTVDIMYNEVIIMSVSDNDAIWNNTTRFELANSYKERITHALIVYKDQTSILTITKEAGLAIIVILSFAILIYYLKKLLRWTAHKIVSSENTLLFGIKIKNYVLLDSKSQVTALLSINTFIKWVLILISIYIALPILFGIFPWTKNFAGELFGYILTPIQKIALGLWHYLPNLITIIVIIFVFRYVLKGINYLKTEIAIGHLHIPGFFPDWANPTYQIVRVLLFAFLIVVIFPYLPGSDSPVFRGVSVFLGFLFTFGSAGSLSNIVAGLVLTYMRLFKIGDYVKIGEVVGNVIEKSLLVTRVRTIKNEIVSIPNSTIMNSHTINYSSDAANNGLIVHTTVTIGYNVPWKDIHQALIDAALKTNQILKEPKPFVLQTGLEDFYVAYQINAYTRDPNDQAIIYSDLHQNIQDTCFERGIEILSPHYKAARDGNGAAIPLSYLPKDYKAPNFNINITKTNTEENKEFR